MDEPLKELSYLVVPYIGSRIETVDNRYACPSVSVVPYIGTCIGQKLIHVS